MINIPLREAQEYTFRIDLDSIPCDCRIYWVFFSETIATDSEGNSNFPNSGYWMLDIKNTIFDIKGIKLVGGTDLMWPYAYSNFGSFLIVDLSGQNRDPEFTGMGNNWILRYYTIAEREQFREDINLEIPSATV